MKKTINISLAKQKFILEEDAYTRLTNYFEEIKKHLGQDVDGNEVIEDIEASIAEKFKKVINKNKEIITLSDVEEIIKVMGTEEDFNREMGTEDKKENKSKRRKLYRDPDTAIFGGVSGGIAKFFNLNIIVVRLLFIVLTFFSKGFGILLYIILWITVPKAKTAYQKLEMYGEEPTIDTLKDLSSKIKSKTPSFINKSSDKLEYILRIFWNIFKKIVSFLFVIASLLGIIFVGFVAVSSLLYKNSGYMINFIPINDLIQGIPYNIMLATGFIALIIPLLMILLQAIAILRKKKILTFGLVAILVSIWMLGSIIFTSMAIRYLPEVVNKVDNHKDVQRVSQILDTENIKLLKVSGSRIIIRNAEASATNTVIEGRRIDLNYINISKDGESLTISRENYQNNDPKCLFCEPETIVIKIPLNREFEIATSSQARFIHENY